MNGYSFYDIHNNYFDLFLKDGKYGRGKCVYS